MARTLVAGLALALALSCAPAPAPSPSAAPTATRMPAPAGPAVPAPTAAPLPPRAPGPAAAAKPPTLIRTRADRLKPVYDLGEPVRFEAVIANVSGGPLTIEGVPPDVSVVGPGRQTVRTLPGGAGAVDLAPGGEYRRLVEWDGRDAAGQLPRPGRYGFGLSPLLVGGGTQITTGLGAGFVLRPPEGFHVGFLPVYEAASQDGVVFSLDRVWLSEGETRVDAHLELPVDARDLPGGRRNWDSRVELRLDGAPFAEQRGPAGFAPNPPYLPTGWTVDPIPASAQELAVIFTVSGAANGRWEVRVPLAPARPFGPEPAADPPLWRAAAPGWVATERGQLCLLHAVVHEHRHAIVFLAALGPKPPGLFRYVDGAGRDHHPLTTPLLEQPDLWVGYQPLQAPLPRAGHVDLRVDGGPALRLIERLQPGVVGPQRLESPTTPPCQQDGTTVSARTAFHHPGSTKAGVVVEVQGPRPARLHLLLDTADAAVRPVDPAAFAAAERSP